MNQEQVTKLQEALTTVGQVCDQHVGTASDHRLIAAALKTITDALTGLIQKNKALEAQVQRLNTVSQEVEKVDCGAV